MGMAAAIEAGFADQFSEWPEALSNEAFHGLAGEIVAAIEPQTEADKAAVLLQVLVAFGALVGRGPHFKVEGDEHHANLFALIVGDTAKARKGTSWSRVRESFSKATDWPPVVNGLSSGEGLKWHVRDAGMNGKKVDPGVADKRLLVVEAEFEQVLDQCVRPGNTLSSVLRSAWDGSKLQTLTKNDPVTATGAHISIIGHITAHGLRAKLTATEGSNGFANRFLFMCARRSKLLPFGGEGLSASLISHFASRLARAAGKARQLQALPMSNEAMRIWNEVYGPLSDCPPSLFGAVTARAEAHCRRLALVYALLDEASSIGGAHVLAALAVWDRARASARLIFGNALGDPKADEILRALIRAGDAGMTRTEIIHLFNRHETAERIGIALDLLRKHRLAAPETQPTRGAPIERWYATSAKQANKAKKGTAP